VTDSAALARRALAQRDSMRREVARRDSVRREIARRDSVRRATAIETSTGAPSGEASAAIPREAQRETPPVRTPASTPTRRDDQDLMLLSDSLAKAGGRP
jgi:hypothetical protein